MKRVLPLLIVLVVAGAVQAQTQKLESVNIVRNGWWEVVSPDTLTRHPDYGQAIERQINLLLQGIPEDQIVIKPPLYEVRPSWGNVIPDTVFQTEYDTVYVDAPTDTVWAYEQRTLYAAQIPEGEAWYYDEHPAVRNIDWQIIEDHPDSTEFRVRIFGQTTANKIRFASKCIGYDSTMSAIDDRVGMTLTADSTGFVDGETADFTCHPPGGNASMNYWLTGYTDADTVIVRKYIDVAHIRSIGN